MNATISKRTLLEGLSSLERVIPTRSSNPILTYLWVEGLREGLRFRGSNGEIDLELTLPAEVEGVGRALVPAQPFFQLAKSLPEGGAVELRLEEKLELAAGSFRTHLGIASVESYPELVFPHGQGERLLSQELLRALGRVRYACSHEEYRAVFRGVQLELGSSSRAVASDGFRLALSELRPIGEQSRKMVVPARAVDELLRVFAKVEEELELALGEGELVVRGGGLQMKMRLMEGEFPDYERVIPRQIALEALIGAPELVESLKRVSVLADRSNRRVDLLFAGTTLEVVAEGDFGQGREELALEEGQGQMMASYNAQYLIDALNPIQGRVRLQLSGPTTPTLIRDDEDPAYLAVVVPLRV
jgi:DNA polymerase-3 subunit beta